jgi:hypothetical protein|tara:strand:+ start:1238 stop:1594 length:357 start_codon:yes stop_codon:yes gene_type:complete
MIRNDINNNKGKTMNTAKKLKAEEKKIVLAYIEFKLKRNRLDRELFTMRESVVNLFKKTKLNILMVQNKQGETLGLQKRTIKRLDFNEKKFKADYPELHEKYKEMKTQEQYKTLADTN